MANIRISDSDRDFINSELKRCKIGSPYHWNQPTVVSMALRNYRAINKIVLILSNKKLSPAQKCKEIELIISTT